MATEDTRLRSGEHAPLESLSTAIDYARRGLYEVTILAALAVWTVFWGALVRLQYLQNNTGIALFTAVVVIGPPLVGYAWHALRLLDVR